MSDTTTPTRTAHTPGPWSLKTVPTSDGSCHKIGPFPSASRVHSETHACVYASGIRLGIDDSTPVARELLANARLIAAAPELLDALTRMLKQFPADSDLYAAGWDSSAINEACDAYDTARAAIRKATGEE